MDDKNLFPNPAAEENLWWRSILSNVPDMVMTVDREGKILYINHTVPGFTIEKVIGTTVYNYVPSGYHENEKQALERVFRTGEMVDFEIAGAGPDGSAAWYQSHLAPIKGPTGSVDAVTLVTSDITKRKISEDEIAKLKAEVEQLKLKPQ